MSNVEAVFRRLRNEAGIEDITIHGLRHTYATMALRAGADIKFISLQLGHKSVKTTYDIYVDYASKELRDIQTDRIAVTDVHLDIEEENQKSETA